MKRGIKGMEKVPPQKIRFIIIGSGWRSLFYVRIAKRYPQEFELISMVFRTEEKAEKFRKEYDIPVTTDIEQAAALKPDFAVIAVNKASICETALFWAEKGIPVLTETPSDITLEGLKRLWQAQKEGARIQTAEQYPYFTEYQAVIQRLREGLIGKPDFMSISAVHDYHAVSLIRLCMGLGFDRVRMRGKRYGFSIVETDSRYGKIRDGRMGEKTRDHIIMEFEHGQTVFYDFSGVQYHSDIRTSHFSIQGPRGEICDNLLLYVDGENQPVSRQVMEEELLPWQIRDENAIACCMRHMKRYVETGKEEYCLKEALQDAYLALLMKEAAEHPEKEVESENQPWMKEEK